MTVARLPVPHEASVPLANFQPYSHEFVVFLGWRCDLRRNQDRSSRAPDRLATDMSCEAPTSPRSKVQAVVVGQQHQVRDPHADDAEQAQLGKLLGVCGHCRDELRKCQPTATA